MSGVNPEIREGVQTRDRDMTTEPPMYRVLILNDDYTTMEFVVELLMAVFNKPFEEATRIMLNIHKSGKGVCGIYTYEIAETKVKTVHDLARNHGFPLKSTIEKV